MAGIALWAGKKAIFPLSILIWQSDKLQFDKLKLYANGNKHLHTQWRETEARKHLPGAYRIFQSSFFLKDLSRLAIYLKNRQYLWHCCRRFLVVQAVFWRLTCTQKRFGTCSGEGVKEDGFPVGTLDEATLIQGSRGETLRWWVHTVQRDLPFGAFDPDRYCF